MGRLRPCSLGAVAEPPRESGDRAAGRIVRRRPVEVGLPADHGVPGLLEPGERQRELEGPHVDDRRAVRVAVHLARVARQVERRLERERLLGVAAVNHRRSGRQAEIAAGRVLEVRADVMKILTELLSKAPG